MQGERVSLLSEHTAHVGQRGFGDAIVRGALTALPADTRAIDTGVRGDKPECWLLEQAGPGWRPTARYFWAPAAIIAERSQAVRRVDRALGLTPDSRIDALGAARDWVDSVGPAVIVRSSLSEIRRVANCF